ncbi:MAG: metallophosphoesterase [Ruminococcaceae bacterium]|nr:metallophosphoesterase [Oscillospiraceae bacterium]
MKDIPSEFRTTPIVYAVGKSYRIIVPVSRETVMWVMVGDRCFYDDSNGILRSANTTHRMTVPAELLDREKRYTVCYRVIHKRKPYFTESGEVQRYESEFRPVIGTPIRLYHIADAHNLVDEPVSAGRYFGDRLDLLVLNGDIPNHSGDVSFLTTIHLIAAHLTNGELPVVFSRGNHDTRGIHAEKIEEHTPTENGRSYFTFRVGHLWGIVMDCGEDKADTHAEYGNTVCCGDFRRRQTAYLKDVIARKSEEYEAEGVLNRMVICHVPFTEKFPEPFNIEEDTYAEWARLLREEIHPQVMLCGHMHRAYISPVGGDRDYLGQPCPVVVASQRSKENKNYYVGGAITLYPDRCRVQMTDNQGACLLEQTLLFE